ncbi:uncharacterized protein LOC106163609 isoform X1 [Lingula anatina]|uniref:Uncharacterized protein LOC106163609 isoform X1 n=1 Tax=Lingula anatina TaxID=7574 RepID=A0A1S3IEP8_LINAN|nr:uncharacterized protein LOC106163609 isoform X1 [Lingula anatina]|eukprot:XP_013396707.1 uncharacterized protein LOC106163609 isoform X1 [Lingula anatina]
MASRVCWLIYLTIVMSTGSKVKASFSNEGTEFYVGFMDNDYGDGRDMYLYMTTGSNTPAEVTVTAPKQDTNFRKTAQIARGQSVRVSIPANFKATGSRVENKGIHVMSTQPISLYGLNQEQGSGDAFTAIPVTGLGSRYSAITWSNQGQILVVSTQDRTEVTIKLPGRPNNAVTFNGVAHTGYAEFTVTMSRYQTLHLQSDDLTTTQIVANSAIAVFSGSKKVQIEGTMTSDHLVQQLTPYDAWGKEFLISAPPNSQKYKMKIMSQDRHPNIGRVYISGEAASGTFVTEFYTPVRDYTSAVLRRVWSDSPIQVALFTQSMDSSSNMIDASMIIVPPVYQYRSRYTFTTLGQTAAEMSSHMTIYVANVTTNAGTLRMDGQPMNMSFTRISSTNYYVGTMPVSPGAHEIYSTDPLTNFYGLMSGFHASSNGNYYVTYPAGMNVAKNTLGCSPFVGQNIVAGNQVDEDCDGRVDEEIKNNIDDDGDGKIDEDLSLPPRANGNWGPWGSWEACSVTCENGTKSRRRQCNNPEPTNGGLTCPTDIQGDTDTVPCSLQRCPECDPAAAVSCITKPNTVCSANRFCECGPGYRDTTGLGHCVKRKIGDTCILSTDCNTVVGYSRCVEGRCVCSVGYKPGPDNTACVQLTVGDACTSTDQCDVVMDHVTCGTGNTCQCNLGYIATSGQSQCRKRVVGDSCSTDGDCSTAVTGTTCSTSTRRCTCAIGYRPSTDSTSCLARPLNDPCQSTGECSAILPASSSECKLDTDGIKRCFCSDSHREFNSTQCRRAKINDICETPRSATMCTDPIPFSECSASSCVCKAGYMASADLASCTKRAVGSPCSTNNDCQAAVVDSLCSDGTCSCKQGYKYISAESACRKRKIRDACSVSADCNTVVSSSKCEHGRCACSVGYKLEADRTSCLARKIGDTCILTTDCIAVVNNSRCVQGRCVCSIGYKPDAVNTSCLAFVRGASCNVTEDCSTCEVGNADSANDTVCRTTTNKRCSDQGHCRAGSTLSFECHPYLKVCDCPLGFHSVQEEYCVKRKIGSKTCYREADCREAVQHSTCTENGCECIEGYQPSADMTECTEEHQVPVIPVVTASVAVVVCGIVVAGAVAYVRNRRKRTPAAQDNHFTVSEPTPETAALERHAPYTSLSVEAVAFQSGAESNETDGFAPYVEMTSPQYVNAHINFINTSDALR